MHEKTRRSRRVFEGRLLKIDVLDVELDDGRPSVREVVRHPGAAVVLAQLPDDRFVFVRQFRKAVERTLLEVVAGTMQPGENPETCARREVQEETGYGVAALRKLGVVFPAPGYTDEALHLYYARLSAGGGDPSPDEDEVLEVVRLSAGEVDDMIGAGRIEDAKTLAAWLLYRRAGS